MIEFKFPKQILDLSLVFSRELNVENITFDTIIKETIFSTEIENVKSYLSPYGTFFDGITFYYDEEIFSYYEEKHQLQIIMNEYLNFLELYHTTNRKLNDYNCEVIKSEHLFYLYRMGLTNHKVTAANKIRGQLVLYYMSKYKELDVILFAPNANALEYLFDQLFQGHEGVLKYYFGYRMENEDYIYTDSLSLYFYMLAASNLYLYAKNRYDYKIHKTLYSHQIFVYDKRKQQLTKKKSKEYTEFIDAIEIMKRITE